MKSELISTSKLIEFVQDSRTIVVEIADIPNEGVSCIIMVHGGNWAKAECSDDTGDDFWVLHRWPLYPKCEGPVQKDVVVKWLKG